MAAIRVLALLSLVWTSAVMGGYVDDLAELRLNNNTRLKRQSCTDGEFQCKSGECVDYFMLCNGVAECPDSSDETADSCSSFSCPGFAFTCAYGACVDGDARCDGKKDCADGSDEDLSICHNEGKPSGSGRRRRTVAPCYLPPQPENGRFTVVGCEDTDRSLACRAIAASPVQSPTLLNYTCNPGFILDGEAVVLCHNGKLFPSPPTCSRPGCPSLESTTVTASCKLNGETVNCNDGPSPVGTEAVLTCKVSHQVLNEPGYDSIQCSSSGQWTPPPFTCTPVCGTRNPKGKTFLANGIEAKVGEFPWVVAVFRNSTKTSVMSQICGGSLISERLVVSAAHCFWDRNTNKPKPIELYKFAIGKYCRDWDTKEEELQVRDAKDIVVHERYGGFRLNYAYDIAVVMLSVPVELTWAVRPICIDWTNEYERFQFTPGTEGEVAGWWITDKGVPSTEILTTKIQFIDFYKCWNTMPQAFLSYLTADKFCAGYTNGKSLRLGAGGGGLAFERNNLMYLRGITSVGAAPKEDSAQYILFTRISMYLDFIKNLRV